MRGSGFEQPVTRRAIRLAFCDLLPDISRSRITGGRVILHAKDRRSERDDVIAGSQATSVFVLPSNDQFETKNGQERIVVLNSIARRVVDERRGKHPEFVFDRQDLLGHKSQWVTTQYSAPDIARLLESAEKVCERRPNTVLRLATRTNVAQSLTQKGSRRVCWERK